LLQIGRFTDFTDTLKSSVKEKGLEDYITFTDFLKEGFKYTSQFDVFLMSSKSEGLPLTILESFYYKVPVVSTRAGGIPEVVIDKENGLLSDIKDYQDLGKNILLLLNDEKLRNDIVENAYKLVIKTFSADTMANQTISVYNEVLSI
jgi:glycosyltransferase involved in cell wall biosynthesis